MMTPPVGVLRVVRREEVVKDDEQFWELAQRSPVNEVTVAASGRL